MTQRSRSVAALTRLGLATAACVATLAVGLVGPQSARASWPTVYLAKRFSGLSAPVFVTGDGTGERTYIVERAGKILVAPAGGATTTSFLDISSKVDTSGERGLLGLAFAPGYAGNGRFYVYYVDSTGMTHVARFARSGVSSDQADPSSETTILEWQRPTNVHNGGWMQFGPDGMLYVSSGDGGPQGDPSHNAQSLAVLLGKILRIDVESGVQTYTVPADNPFAATAGARPEIWMYGLRNPWRCSIDSAGELFIGDVGLNSWEEIDFAPPGSKALNFGWNLYEGGHPYPPGSVAQPSNGLTFPVAEYPHPVGEAVIGGYLYEGTKFPAMQQTYFYADYLTGKVWGMQRSGSGWSSQLLLQNALTYSSFGTDDANNLYLCSWGNGQVYEVCASQPTSCTLSTGSSWPKYGAHTAIRGTLRASGTGLAGASVRLQTSTDGKAWKNSSLTSTTSVDGGFSFSVSPTVKTYYRVWFASSTVGGTGYVTSVSGQIRLLPCVSLTTPQAPALAAAGRSFSAYSLLRPHHATGGYPVDLRCYRYESGKWVLRKVVKLRASDLPRYPWITKVSASVSLPSRGAWRLVAYHPLDSLNAATVSSPRAITVK